MCEDVGLVVVDNVWAGVVAGSFLVRRSPAGLGALRDIWECQFYNPAHADQASMYEALLVRTPPAPRASKLEASRMSPGEPPGASARSLPYPRHHCMTHEQWKPAGWRGQTQCFIYWMERLGRPYGARRSTGVKYVDPRGIDFQAFSFHNYGDRADDQLVSAYGANPALDASLSADLHLATNKHDIVFRRGDLLLHSSMLGSPCDACAAACVNGRRVGR